MSYKWNNPLEWLMDQLEYLVDVIPLLDPDAVQDLFQNEMEIDGYFEEDTD